MREPVNLAQLHKSRWRDPTLDIRGRSPFDFARSSAPQRDSIPDSGKIIAARSRFGRNSAPTL
jgi:hypothetical protein